MADRILTNRIACRFVPTTTASALVASAYGVLPGGVIARQDCLVKDPADIPYTRTLADSRALIDTLRRAYLQNDSSLFREEKITPYGDQGGEPQMVPHGLLLGFYLRVLAKTIAADPGGLLGKALARDLGPLIVPILTRPDRRPPGSRGQYMEESVIGVAELAKATGAFDVVAWPLLWGWASNRQAQPRTRVFAMQTIEAIINRGTIPPSPKMLAMVEELQRSVSDWETMWPTYSDEDKRERALTVAQANSTIATAATKLAEKGFDTSDLMPVSVPPTPSRVPWVPILGVGVGSVGLVILALAVRSRSRRPKPALTRRRRR